MRRRTLGLPLLAVAGAVASVTAAGSLWAIVQARDVDRHLKAGTATQAHLIQALHEVGDAMSRERANAIKAGYSVDRNQRAEIDAQFRRSVQRFEAADGELRKLAGADLETVASIESLERRWRDYARGQDAIFSAALLGPDGGPPRLGNLPQLNELCNVVTSNLYGDVVGALSDVLDKTAIALDRELREADRAMDMVVPALSSMLLLVLCACFGLGAFALRRLVGPLRDLGENLGQIASGRIEEPVLVGMDRRDEIGQIARHLDRLREGLRVTRRADEERQTLSQLTDWLQSVKSEAELYAMVSEVLSRLIPDCAGALYIYTASRETLELVRSWNGADAPAVIVPDDCWGLRRGHPYVHGAGRVAFRCDHLSGESGHDYCCVPLLAHGETIGLLHLDHRSVDPKARFDETCRLGALACEHVALAIANVKLREQLLEQSIRDVLTGLYNRRYVLERGQAEIRRAQRLGRSISVLSIDIDHFKSINDAFGHDAGDAVIRSLGELFQASADPDGIACRFGGEEFLLLLPDVSPEEAARRAETIRRSVERMAITHPGAALPGLSISIGVAAFPLSGETLAEVLKAADVTLYEAKRAGRNRVEMAACCRPAATPSPC